MSNKEEHNQKACEYCLSKTASCAFSLEQKRDIEQFPWMKVSNMGGNIFQVLWAMMSFLFTDML